VKFQGEINFGANITVLERPRIAACSNCDGEYSLEGLIAGTYTIQVTGLPLGTVITEKITVGGGDVEHDFDGSLSFDSYAFHAHRLQTHTAVLLASTLYRSQILAKL
jgi:hypothetical protein